MQAEYMKEGYQLMTEYITENRIKTKNRTFLRGLNKFYEAHKNDNILDEDAELEYLELEKQFYTSIAAPEKDEDKALV